MWGRKSKVTLAKTAATKADSNAYRDRKLKKRDNRALQTLRINAAARERGTTYSVLINQLKKKNIVLDRKVLSQIAQQYPEVFSKIIA